jgi:hypothetical protein
MYFERIQNFYNIYILTYIYSIYFYFFCPLLMVFLWFCFARSPAEGSISSGSGAAAGSLHGGAGGVGPTGTNSGVISPQEPTYVNL